MDKFSNWFRIIITWIVIIPDLFLSYYYLRYPSFIAEVMSLGLNFVATTVLFYIYVNLSRESDTESEEGGKTSSEQSLEGSASLYKLTFGPLIEDMLVWLGLFFLLYNIIPITLYVHNLAIKSAM